MGLMIGVRFIESGKSKRAVIISDFLCVVGEGIRLMVYTAVSAASP